jgi:hypothetical protein
MLSKYHFKIKHIKNTNNTKADVLNQKAKLQKSKKPSKTILKLYKNRKIRYNHPKLATTQEYKTPKSDWE